MDIMNQTIELEIIELNQFFQDWISGGVLHKDHSSFKRFSLVMENYFTIVPPLG